MGLLDTIPLSPPLAPRGKSPSNPNAGMAGYDVPLTLERVKAAVPLHLQVHVRQELVDMLNTMTTDPVAAEHIRENFITYGSVLREGKYRIQDYINAVTYVSYRLMGMTNLESYTRTFPQRYADLIARNVSSKDIAGYVAAFHRGQLVNLITQQVMVPVWVLNQDLFQKALNVQADLMMNSHSDKVRTDAANSLLSHLKKPESKEFQISLETAESSGIKEMKSMLQELAERQRDAIREGQMKTIDVAGTRLKTP